MIWNYRVEEIARGFVKNENNYECIICQKAFQKGRIYEINHELYDAEGAVSTHLKSEHHSMAAYLLDQGTGLMGLSEVQSKFLKMILEGKMDKEIGEMLGIAQSTVRNHRFKLREKEKQAKLFTALMLSIEAETHHEISKSDVGVIEDIHMSATMVDDRYTITAEERQKTIQTYMKEDGSIKQFPSREKKKIIVLGEVIKHFDEARDYEEKEVNKILKEIYEEDYPTLRRALIEYGFMERSIDCKKNKYSHRSPIR